MNGQDVMVDGDEFNRLKSHDEIAKKILTYGLVWHDLFMLLDALKLVWKYPFQVPADMDAQHKQASDTVARLGTKLGAGV